MGIDILDIFDPIGIMFVSGWLHNDRLPFLAGYSGRFRIQFTPVIGAVSKSPLMVYEPASFLGDNSHYPTTLPVDTESSSG